MFEQTKPHAHLCSKMIFLVILLVNVHRLPWRLLRSVNMVFDLQCPKTMACLYAFTFQKYKHSKMTLCDESMHYPSSTCMFTMETRKWPIMNYMKPHGLSHLSALFCFVRLCSFETKQYCLWVAPTASSSAFGCCNVGYNVICNVAFRSDHEHVVDWGTWLILWVSRCFVLPQIVIMPVFFVLVFVLISVPRFAFSVLAICISAIIQ